MNRISLPGTTWDLSAYDKKDQKNRIRLNKTPVEGIVFDSLNIDDWFMLEQMDTSRWFLCVAGITFDVYINNGKATLVPQDKSLAKKKLKI